MGSFNLACVATNMTIQEGDRCVAFVVEPIDRKYGRGMPGDSITSPFYITSYPIRGEYADYGHGDADSGKTYGREETTDRLMIFHEWAYEAILSAVHAERARYKAWEDACYAEREIPQYRIDRANRLVNAPEGEAPHATFWNKKIAESDSPRKEYGKYKEHVEIMFACRHTFHFQFHPSRYAGQEFELKGLLTLHAAMGNYLLEQQKRWNEDEEL